MGEVFDLVAPQLLGLFATMVPDPSAREAIVRQTMLDVWRRSPVAVMPHGALSWVTSIALGHVRSSAAVSVAGGRELDIA